jgi:hypothetical protein
MLNGRNSKSWMNRRIGYSIRKKMNRKANTIEKRVFVVLSSK